MQSWLLLQSFPGVFTRARGTSHVPQPRSAHSAKRRCVLSRVPKLIQFPPLNRNTRIIPCYTVPIESRPRKDCLEFSYRIAYKLKKGKKENVLSPFKLLIQGKCSRFAKQCKVMITLYTFPKVVLQPHLNNHLL